jgi:uncharacterized protein (TIGR03000 family)
MLMPTKAILSFAPAAVAVILLLGSAGSAPAQHGHGGFHGGYHGGYYHGGYWHGGYWRPYGYYPGWYRPYPFIGIGFGFGLYAPYYGSYVYPLAPGAVYDPYAPALAYSSPAGTPPAGPPPAGQTGPAPQQFDRPPPDSAGHLQLLVPANADVFIDGNRVAGTGTTREIVTPTLKANTRYTYKISVQYTDAQGKQQNDTRDITFQANDWFAIDFTRPAPPMAPAPQPLPNSVK